MVELFVFIYGLVIGSFLNVVIYRSIEGISIIKPSSFCPNCKAEIKYYDNIPVISYIILKGRCRNCKEKISILYPVIEILTGFITLILFLKWKDSPIWFISSLIISYTLIIISVIDFKIMMLSDLFSYILASTGILSSYFNPLFEGNFYSKITSSISGIITGAGLIYILIKAGKIIYKKDAVGDGDMFLLGAIGSFVGARGVFDVIIIASFLGGLYGVILIVAKNLSRSSYIPFGPFLALSSFIKIYSNIDVFNLINTTTK